jgi:hypothetical protein
LSERHCAKDERLSTVSNPINIFFITYSVILSRKCLLPLHTETVYINDPIPRVQKFIVVEGLELRSLYRSLKRDYSNPRKLWFNFQHHHRMKLKRQELMEEILSRGELVVLDNYPDLSDEEIVWC